MLTKHGIKKRNHGDTHTHGVTLKGAKTGISSNQMATSWSHGDINKRQINHDRSRISVRWSKWFKEAKTADHSFSSISFQRLTKMPRHFKLLSVPHSECSASIASKLWKLEELPMASLKCWINSSFSACHVCYRIFKKTDTVCIHMSQL